MIDFFQTFVPPPLQDCSLPPSHFCKEVNCSLILDIPWISKVYCICIQLIMVILLHPHRTLLHPLPDLWLSLVVKFLHYMNHAFPSDTNPAKSLWGAGSCSMTHEWDRAAEHAFSYLCDEFKCSVDKAGHLLDAMQIVSSPNSSQDDVAGSSQPLQAQIYICVAYPPCWKSPEPSTLTPYICYLIASPLTIYLTLLTLVERNKHLISTTQTVATDRNLRYNLMSSGCQNQSSQLVI